MVPVAFDFAALLNEYFVAPIVNYSGYNPINTLVYAAILIGVAFFIIFPALDKRGIKFNARFMLCLMPYILFGISLRILEDLHLLHRSPYPWEVWYYTVSPGIWVLVGLTTIACVFIARKIAKAKGLPFRKVFASLGFGLWLPFLALNLLHFSEWFGFAAILFFTAAAVAAVYFIAKPLRPSFAKNKLNLLAVSGQALDGFATFVATSLYRCGEQHFTSGFILSLHPLLFPVAKVLLALAIIWFADREIENENMRGFAKIFIAIAGFAPGLRDLFTVAVGTCL